MFPEKKDMDEISALIGYTELPGFYRVKNNISGDAVRDVKSELLKAFKRENTLGRIESGSTVAITAGSREIQNLPFILKTLIGALQKIGAHPFIFPAMGSHGGATAEGQLAILHSYGLTEEEMGVPIYSSMETVEVGRTLDGLAVHVDKRAYEADYIIPVNRIKPHPEFRGLYESGLMKMLAIGMGKQHGAHICHQLGMSRMSENILSFGKVLLEKCSIPFGIGILENAVHETYKIVSVPAELIPEEEPGLLKEARVLVPPIPFKKVDVIICEEMGKEISGTGMDSNVIGRSISLGVSAPFAERIGILDLTEKSHGNFNGVGLGDSITRRLFEKMSFPKTYPNSITASEPFAVKIPPVMDSDRLCVNFCVETCLNTDEKGIRIVWIKNTLSMDSFFISEALFEEASKNPALEPEKTLFRPEFGKDGAFIGFNREDGES